MNEWKKAALVLIVSAATLGLAGANGRSVAWATPEGEESIEAIQEAPVHQPSESLASAADADADNGPGCAEASLSH